MHIVFFSRYYYPHIGGVEKHVYEISKGLIKKGNSVTIISEKYDKELKVYEKHEKIDIYRIPLVSDERQKKYIIWIWILRNFKILKNADVIHCHDVFFWYLPFRFILPFKKIYTTFHGYEGDKLPNWKSKLNHKIAEILSHGNICVGDYLKKWYGTRPDYVIYGGANLIHATGNKYKRKSAVFVGRLEEEANIMNYLKALKILKTHNINISLTVLGDGALRGKAEEFALENKLNATFKGFVEDVFQYVQQCEFVFTSRFLGTLEALSMKKFVFVVYNNEILKDAFFMSPFRDAISISGDHYSLNKNIQNYIHNKKLRDEKIRIGYGWVKKQTWAEITKMYLNLWKNEK